MGPTAYPEKVRDFFANCESLDYLVLRPLDHIASNWDLRWDFADEKYIQEDDSFAQLLNVLIEEMASTTPPIRYHDNEDRLAEFVRDGPLKWPINKVKNRWIGMDYQPILQAGAFDDIDQSNLVSAATGRVWAAITRQQIHFDDMEESHQRMLGAVISIVVYQRSSGL